MRHNAICTKKRRCGTRFTETVITDPVLMQNTLLAKNDVSALVLEQTVITDPFF